VKPIRACALLSALLAVAGPASGDTQTWQSLAEDSELQFKAYYEGEALPGQFGAFRVTLRTDAGSGVPQALEVEVDTASADMRDREFNQEIAEPAWFDVQAFPAARFESDSITGADGVYQATGRLRLKGVERPLELEFELVTSAGKFEIKGSTRLARLDWGIGTGEWSETASLSDRVDLSWRVSLVQSP